MADSKDNTKDWLGLATSAYTDSTSYFQSDLFSQWEDNIKMFKNEHPSGSKYNKEIYNKRSKVFRPKTRSSCMKFEAAVSTAYFANADIVDIRAHNPVNDEQVLSAKLYDNLLQYRLTQSIPWFKLVCGAAQEVWKMGAVVSYQDWAFEEGKTDEPVVKLMPLENFRIHPCADWLDPIGTSPYLVVLTPYFVHQVKAKQEAGEWDDTVTDTHLLAAKNLEGDPMRLARNKNTDPKDQKQSITEYDTVFVHENIVIEDGEVYVYETLGLTHMLSEPKLLRDVYPHGIPYVFGICLLEPFRVFTTGMPELGQNIQEEMNNIANDRLDNVKLVLNKRYFAKRGRNVDFRSLLRNVPGSITMMDDPQADVEVISTPDITQSSYAEQDRLNVDYDEMIGNFSSGSVSTNSNLNETVGGMGMIASGAGQITEYLIRIFNETWVEPVLRQLVQLERLYESDKTVLEIASNDEEIQAFKGKVTDLLDEDVLVNVNAGISATNPQFKLEKLLFGINSMTQVLENPNSKYMDLREIGSEIFGCLGYRDGSRFFPGVVNGVDPQVQKLEEQVAQLAQQLESKNAETQAKLQVDMKKLELEAERLVLDREVAQVDATDTQADVQKTLAEIAKINAEITEMTNQDNAVEVEKLQLDALKLMNDREKFLEENKTKRDAIMADLKKSREELEAKLEITRINSQGRGSTGISKDLISQKKKEEKSK